ncbi:hypothetical protein CU098_007642 [Rhizopus stolonifer]|uniref:Uncharacterized protein n=1 Tax=Rhizopus stolonifer TaxID=4846 RepID=A0A367IY08_RHIST|nr:hypothetical protein CU098_007642 [Rhizopus stolonifer]
MRCDIEEEVEAEQAHTRSRATTSLHDLAAIDKKKPKKQIYVPVAFKPCVPTAMYITLPSD